METMNRELTVRESMDSKFRYVLLVAQRAEQIMRGARPKIVLPETKATTVAKEEIDRGLIEWDYGPRPEPVLEALAEVRDEGEASPALDEPAEEGVH
jgi:DNA-directed RNA polymerase subunit K/omega